MFFGARFLPKFYFALFAFSLPTSPLVIARPKLSSARSSSLLSLDSSIATMDDSEEPLLSLPSRPSKAKRWASLTLGLLAGGAIAGGGVGIWLWQRGPLLAPPRWPPRYEVSYTISFPETLTTQSQLLTLVERERREGKRKKGLSTISKQLGRKKNGDDTASQKKLRNLPTTFLSLSPSPPISTTTATPSSRTGTSPRGCKRSCATKSRRSSRCSRT